MYFIIIRDNSFGSFVCPSKCIRDIISLPLIVIQLQNKCFQWYTGISLSVRPCVCPTVCPSIRMSVCVRNISFCQSAGGGIKSHSVRALVYSVANQLQCLCPCIDRLGHRVFVPSVCPFVCFLFCPQKPITLYNTIPTFNDPEKVAF